MGQIDLITKKADVLPMAKYYMDQLGVKGLFAKYVQGPRSCPVDLATLLSIMMANIVCASHALYKIQ
jgi:hypothetical protein